MIIPKTGDFPLSLEGVGGLNGLNNEFTILKLGLGAPVLVLRYNGVICVLNIGAVNTEGGGKTGGVAGDHC